MASLTYTVEEAAERLGPICSVAWLKKHMRTIPHRKSGNGVGRAGRVAFTDDDLAAILAMLEVKPKVVADPDDYLPVTRRRAEQSARVAS